MPRPAPQIDRVVAILNVLAARDEGGTLTELANEVGASPSTMVHVLAAMVSAGFLVRETSDRRYHLGPALVEPGRVAAARYPALAIARRQMDRLSRTFEAPCFAFVRERRWARLVHYTWDPSHPVPPMKIGETVPVVPPLCAVFMAWAPPEDVQQWFAADPALPPARIDALRTALGRIRELGFVVEGQPAEGLGDHLLHSLQEPPSPARDRELRRLLSNHDGHLVSRIQARSSYRTTGIGAPVFTPAGTVALSITLSTFDRPLTGRELNRIGRVVREAADTATAELGGHEPLPPPARPAPPFDLTSTRRA